MQKLRVLFFYFVKGDFCPLEEADDVAYKTASLRFHKCFSLPKEEKLVWSLLNVLSC